MIILLVILDLNIYHKLKIKIFHNQNCTLYSILHSGVRNGREGVEENGSSSNDREETAGGSQ